MANVSVFTPGFLSDVLMKQMALEMTYDDVQLRILGQLLLNSTTANTIIDQHLENIEMAMFKILRRWKNQKGKTSESILVSICVGLWYIQRLHCFNPFDCIVSIPLITLCQILWLHCINSVDCIISLSFDCIVSVP